MWNKKGMGIQTGLSITADVVLILAGIALFVLFYVLFSWTTESFRGTIQGNLADREAALLLQNYLRTPVMLYDGHHTMAELVILTASLPREHNPYLPILELETKAFFYDQPQYWSLEVYDATQYNASRSGFARARGKRFEMNNLITGIPISRTKMQLPAAGNEQQLLVVFSELKDFTLPESSLPELSLGGR